MPSFHFDCGNSTQGAVGICARVTAGSREEALELLREFLAAADEIALKRTVGFPGDEDIEYCNIYISPENVSVDDIDDKEPEGD